MSERKWQMTRFGTGDYILPSNDRSTFWRLVRYEESDGTLTRNDGTVIHGTFWSVYRWKHAAWKVATEDPRDWANWEYSQGLLPSRAAAIDAALGAETGEAP